MPRRQGLERRIQRVRKAIESVGQSRSDWEIICAIAKAMGKGEREVFLNRVTSPHRDRYAKSPEYKVTAVRIEKGITRKGERR